MTSTDQDKLEATFAALLNEEKFKLVSKAWIHVENQDEGELLLCSTLHRF